MSEILTVIISLIPVLVILFIFMMVMRLLNSMSMCRGRSEREDGERYRRTSLLTGRTKWDEEDEDDDWVFDDDDEESIPAEELVEP